MLRPVRTTVTIEPDLAESLRRRARQDEASFKSVLNDALRRGLQEGDSPPATPFVQRSSEMGLRAGIDLTKANRLADELEDAELVRKLEQRR